jgi:cell wall-associated NlpC family hydrolase
VTFANAPTEWGHGALVRRRGAKAGGIVINVVAIAFVGATITGGLPSLMIPKRRALATAALVSLSFVGVTGFPGMPVVAASAAVSAAPSRSTGPTSNATVVSAIAALDSLRAGDTANYQVFIAQLAEQVAGPAELDPSALAQVWIDADATRMTALLSALTQVGVAYRRNTATPGSGFDCSGLVSWAWSQAGIDLAHQSRSIINDVSATSLDEVQPGDVIYYPGHIEMALGLGDSFVHSPRTGKTVEVRPGHRSSKKLKFGNPLG